MWVLLVFLKKMLNDDVTSAHVADVSSDPKGVDDVVEVEIGNQWVFVFLGRRSQWVYFFFFGRGEASGFIFINVERMVDHRVMGPKRENV